MSESKTIFNERDWKCAAVQLMLSTDPSYDNRTIASTLARLPRITGTCPGWWKQSFRLRLWSLVWFQVRATSCHLTSSKSAWKLTPGCAEECGDTLVQSGGWWQTLGVAVGLGAGPQGQRDPGLASDGVIRLCTLLSLAPLLPLPEPARLLRLVIRREHHQHDLPQHQSQPDRRHPPSNRRAPAGACGKDILPVPDPYRGGDWGWMRLHWIALLHNQVNWIDFFYKSFKIKLYCCFL